MRHMRQGKTALRKGGIAHLGGPRASTTCLSLLDPCTCVVAGCIRSSQPPFPTIAGVDRRRNLIKSAQVRWTRAAFPEIVALPEWQCAREAQAAFRTGRRAGPRRALCLPPPILPFFLLATILPKPDHQVVAVRTRCRTETRRPPSSGCKGLTLRRADLAPRRLSRVGTLRRPG